MAVNSHKLSWTNPTQNTDGTPYNHQTQGGGYELALDGTVPSLALPFAFGTEFTLDNSAAPYADLKSGPHTLRLRVVTKEGVASDWTSPGSFQKVGQPLAPSNLAVA